MRLLQPIFSERTALLLSSMYGKSLRGAQTMGIIGFAVALKTNDKQC